MSDKASNSSLVFSGLGSVVSILSARDQLNITGKQAVQNMADMREQYKANKEEMNEVYLDAWFNRQLQYVQQKRILTEQHKEKSTTFVSQLAVVDTINNVSGSSYMNDYTDSLDFDEQRDSRALALNNATAATRSITELTANELKLANGLAQSSSALNGSFNSQRAQIGGQMVSGLFSMAASAGELYQNKSDEGLQSHQSKVFRSMKDNDAKQMYLAGSSEDRLSMERTMNIKPYQTPMDRMQTSVYDTVHKAKDYITGGK